jgi:hypothetical protein
VALCAGAVIKGERLWGLVRLMGNVVHFNKRRQTRTK